MGMCVYEYIYIYIYWFILKCEGLCQNNSNTIATSKESNQSICNSTQGELQWPS